MIDRKCDACGENLQDGDLVVQVSKHYTIRDDKEEDGMMYKEATYIDNENTEYHHKECYKQ